MSVTYRIQTQTPQLILNLPPKKATGAKPKPQPEATRPPFQGFPLGMVLEACPDIVDYAKGGISNWRDFLGVAAVVRSMLGISPSAWEAAQSVMGELPAAIVVAAILQRGAAITSAGGYLRELTRQGRGRRIHPRADADGADRQQETRKEEGIGHDRLAEHAALPMDQPSGARRARVALDKPNRWVMLGHGGRPPRSWFPVRDLHARS